MRSTLAVSTESRAYAYSASRSFLLLALVLSAACGSPTTTTPPAGTNVLTLVSGDGQHARLTRELPAPIIVIVRNSAGSAVSGVGITFTTGNGSLSTPTATSDGTGQASVRWTLGTTAGAQTLTARLTSGTGSPLTINATADPAVIVSIQALDGDRQQGVVGTALGVAPSVIVRDAQGAPANGLGVRFTVTAGGGTIGVATVTTDASGRASAGSWTLGAAAGNNAVSATPVDADVVASVPLTFSAVGVAAGGVTSSPMRSYILNSSSVTTVQDSVTGQAFRFRNGAHGTLDVARVTGGTTAPLVGATRFRASFTGPEAVELATVMPSGGESQAFFFGDNSTAATMGAMTNRWWGVPQSRAVGDSAFFLLQPGSAGNLSFSVLGHPSTSNRPAISWAGAAFSSSSLVPRAVRAYAVVTGPPASAWVATIRGYRETVQQTVDWWLATLPVLDASRVRATIAAHNPVYISYGVGVGSGYDYGFSYTGWFPFLTFDDRQPLERVRMVRHETGHYLAHMMLGDANYLTLTNNGPVSDDHAPGEIARGERQSLSEEYAYASQFFMIGNLDNWDLRAVGATGSQSGVREMMLPYRPDNVDFPSLEGFGAAMLAALTRIEPNTMVYDFWAQGSRTRSPALGINTTSVLGILARGPQNPNQLRTMLVPLAGGEEALAAVLEPIGWSYWGAGRVVDPAGQPVAGATVRSIIKVDGEEYRTFESVLTGSDGRFTLRRIYPGTSMLRVYKQNGTRLDSTDAKTFTVPWETTTNTPQVLGDLVLMGLPAYNDINISVGGFASPNTLGTSACPQSFGVIPELNAGVWNSTNFYPLVWSGNHFSTSGSVDYTVPASSGSLAAHNTGSVSISGTVDRMRTDSIWITFTATETTRADAFVTLPAPGAWQLEVLRTVSATIGSVGLASNLSSPATYRGTLHGAAAAVAIAAGTMSYYNVSALIPTFFPYSCNAYSLNPLNADVQVTLRIRP